MRSLLMDKLTQKQMNLLKTGGNKRLFDFLRDYDLIYESPQMRYNTKAAKYYREWLVAFVDGRDFKEEPPGFDEGKELIY